MNQEQQGQVLQDLLHLQTPAIGLAFLPEPPAGISRVDRPAAAGCSYWKRAAAGEVFYTLASDHYGCTVGSHTHGIELPPEKAQEFSEVAGVMVQLDYIRAEELPGIPQRKESFGVAVYGPLQKLPHAPEVVLVRGNARQLMLLAEAAQAAGVAHDGEVMGRPACAMVPQTLQSGRGNLSLGCIGNRVYTGLADDEFYYSLPGDKVEVVINRLATILHANSELQKFHEERRAAAV